MLWNIAAPFFPPAHAGMTRWIDDAISSDRHRFHKIPFAPGNASDWHARAARGTPLGSWRSYWSTASRCFDRADGIVTVFPQLAVMAGAQRRLRRKRVPIVAWCFNLGALPGGPRRAAARWALDGIERFVVHSRGEVPLIADYLGIARDRVVFVPLQRAPIEVEADEDREQPFIVAMGSANRDYATLVEAARRTGLPLTIVASPRSVEGVDLPPNVTLLSGLSVHACHVLARRARFSVVPLADVGAASGQVTVIEAQRLGRPVIATRTIGTVDYIEDGVSGGLVAPADVDALASTMLSLWQDDDVRQRWSAAGSLFAREQLSDDHAGRALNRILDELAGPPR